MSVGRGRGAPPPAPACRLAVSRAGFPRRRRARGPPGPRERAVRPRRARARACMQARCDRWVLAAFPCVPVRAAHTGVRAQCVSPGRAVRSAGRVQPQMGYNLEHPKIAESITDLIGRTPLMRLNKIPPSSAKAEVRAHLQGSRWQQGPVRASAAAAVDLCAPIFVLRGRSSSSSRAWSPATRSRIASATP